MATNRVTFPFTQREAFEALIALVNDGDMVYTHMAKNGDKETVHPVPDKIVEFLTHKIAQLDKQADAPRKLTPQQEKNEITKQGILANMEIGKRYTISDMLTTFDCFEVGTSHNRVSALLSQMGAKGTNEIVRTEEKGKAYFSLA